MTPFPRHILGVDPGKSTGLFLYDTETGEPTTTEVDFPEYGFWLEDTLKTHRPAVACEAFVITANTHKHSANAHWSIGGIKIAEFLCWKYGCAFTVQGQSSAKNFATNDRLKKLGWYRSGMGHGVDAQRQVLLYLVNNQWWSDKL